MYKVDMQKKLMKEYQEMEVWRHEAGHCESYSFMLISGSIYMDGLF